ncbi:PTS glucose transporter subunit IIA [Idiomarina aquatica]|nr:PTS glucose transporter subunit IIA [Idiomarina aquatica]
MWIQLQGLPRFAKIPFYSGTKRVMTLPTELLPITSPANGRFCTVDEHASAFSRNQLFGQGPMIDVTGNQIVAPFYATVKTISSSGDFMQLMATGVSAAVTLTLMFGHGEHFQVHQALSRHVRDGDTVNKGQSLLTLNQALLRAGEPHQSRLSLFIQCPATLTWPTSGTATALDSIIFEEEQDKL